jgi:hypothetical protein
MAYTQNQALNVLVSLFKQMLESDPERFETVRAMRPERPAIDSWLRSRVGRTHLREFASGSSLWRTYYPK